MSQSVCFPSRSVNLFWIPSSLKYKHLTAAWQTRYEKPVYKKKAIYCYSTQSGRLPIIFTKYKIPKSSIIKENTFRLVNGLAIPSKKCQASCENFEVTKHACDRVLDCRPSSIHVDNCTNAKNLQQTFTHVTVNCNRGDFGFQDSTFAKMPRS